MHLLLTFQSGMLMYTASLSYMRPPTSAMGAYSMRSFSFKPRFFTVLGSGQGSGSWSNSANCRQGTSRGSLGGCHYMQMECRQRES